MIKITGGKLKGRKIFTVSGPGYRPATSRVRESLFSSLGSLGFFRGDEVVLDVFAGSGALGFEALSRGAKTVYFLEKMPKACASLKRTTLDLDLRENTVIICKDAFKALMNFPSRVKFDLIFVDPPYAKKCLLEIMNLILVNNLLKTNGVLIAEVEKSFCVEQDLFSLELIKEKLFGQTKVFIWKK